ncbi:glutathione S-transferase [Neptuniibacter sp. CAU 1671]|uniref:glutathione S-transferase family protein n=1 Tax=Neptuniibacter sp. CAU 1671 TaxID=3032593 RepID=UPI0023DA39CC|nr:glutathione S-transferase [Neptuniibacter sp. CAU 1671]MDF2182564.1 glutathione S-transferase [Neptuniibacter sp. CAU 1671]
MKLYDLELSGNCYKVRLFAALTGVPLEVIPVDFLAGEHKQPHMLAMNPWGEIPILVDGDVVLRDAQAILVYIAKNNDLEAWLPSNPAEMAEVVQWLSTAANEIQHGPNSARLVDKFGYALDKQTTLKTSERILSLLEQHLSQHDWLALNRPTIADCAVMPYVALAPEGGVSLTPYPAVQRWIERIRQLPGFISMPGI